MNDMTKGSPARAIVHFAIPVLIGNLFNLAYNLTDTRIVGAMLGNEALAAVGCVSTLCELFTGFLVGLGNGFAVLTARFFGMGQEDRVRKSFSSSLTLGTLTAALLTALSLLFMGPILRILHVSAAQYADARAYLRTILLGLVFCILYNVQASNLRAIGDSFTPLLFLIFSACANVGLDLLFVGPLQTGVRGAALATILSQALAAVLCFVYTRRKYEVLRFTVRDLLPEKSLSTQLFSGGISMGLMNSLVSFGTVSLQSAINSFDTNTIVAHAATRKLSNLYMMPFSVLGTTMATYCGQNYGAGRMDRVRTGLRRVLLIAYLWAGIDCLMSYTIAPRLIVAITATQIPQVVETAVLYQKVDTLFYLLCPTITITRNSLQGLGDHVTPVISSALELVCKVLVAFLLTPVLAYWGIIWAEPIAWSVMVIPLIISIVRRIKNPAP